MSIQNCIQHVKLVSLDRDVLDLALPLNLVGLTAVELCSVFRIRMDVRVLQDGLGYNVTKVRENQGPVAENLPLMVTLPSNGNYHGNRAQQPIKIKVSMVVTTDGKVTTNGKFCARGPDDMTVIMQSDVCLTCHNLGTIASFSLIKLLFIVQCTSSTYKWSCNTFDESDDIDKNKTNNFTLFSRGYKKII